MINTKRIDNVLNKFLKENDFSCVATIGTDFAYWYDKSIITYALAIPDTCDKYFTEYFFELGLRYNADIFLLSFFHELGHHETLEELDDELYNQAQEKKAYIETQEPSVELAKMYHRLYDENAATSWAVDFINNNANRVSILWTDLQKEILQFYKENGLTD